MASAVSKLPPRGSVFADFYAGANPELSGAEIVHANKCSLAAHEAAQTGRIVQIG